MSARKIITDFICPPIPVRACDWLAYYDGDEPDDNENMKAGYGATEAEAIQDLLDAYPSEDGDCDAATEAKS